MSWFSRLRNTLNPAPLDDLLDDEIQEHLRHRAAAFRAEGMSAEEAERHARLAFGNITSIREQSRDIRTSALLEGTLQDVGYAWRMMRRSPTFTLAAVLSLGLAMGANTAVYAILDAAMFRPLPVPQANQLVTLVAPVFDPAGSRRETDSFGYPLYLELRGAAGESARLALFSDVTRGEVQVGGPVTPVERVLQQYVSADAFQTLRIAPQLGRLFGNDEDAGPAIERVAVLSFDYWRRRFNGDPGWIGKQIRINGGAYRVVGVAQQGFSGVEPGRFIDVWLPVMTFDAGVFSNSAARLFHIVGRLTPGASRMQLQARLQPAFRRSQGETIQHNTNRSPAFLEDDRRAELRVESGAVGLSEFRRRFGRPLWLVLSVAAATLLIACANVASLLLARSETRAREMAVRASIGAGRGRLVRQLLTESILLSLLAGGLGCVFAWVIDRSFVWTYLQSSGPVEFDLAVNLRILSFSAALCACSTFLFGVLPALRGASAPAMSALRSRGDERAKFGSSRIFLAIQVAFSFSIVVVGAAFVFTIYSLSTLDLGLAKGSVVVLTMRSNLGTGNEALRRAQELQKRVGALPNVLGASLAWTPLFDAGVRTEHVVVAGQPPRERTEIFYRVSPGLFTALGIPLLEGRDLTFDDKDVAEPIATVVNGAFAHTYFGNTVALGRQFQRSDGSRHQIVGVVANAYSTNLRNGPEPVAYWPMKPPRLFTMYVRTPLDRATVTSMIEAETQRSEPGIQIIDATTLEDVVRNNAGTERLLASVGGVFAALGLVVAAIGVFGVLNYSVIRRRRELGIRAALGANRWTLAFLVVRGLVAVVAGGLAMGLAGSFAIMSAIRSYLFGMGTTAPLVVAAAALLVLAITGMAAAVPAARAGTADPMSALRQD